MSQQNDNSATSEKLHNKTQQGNNDNKEFKLGMELIEATKGV